MSAKLDQLLTYLDRDGVTELVLGVGRPLAFKTADGYRPITAAALTQSQIDSMLVGSPLDGLLESTSDRPFAVHVGRRRIAIEILRVGEHPVLRIMHAAPAAAEVAAPVETPRPVSQPLPVKTQQPRASTSALASFPRPASTPSPLAVAATAAKARPPTPAGPGDFAFDDQTPELELEGSRSADSPPMAAVASPAENALGYPVPPREPSLRMKTPTGRVAPIATPVPAQPAAVPVVEATPDRTAAPDSIIDERSDVSAIGAVARGAFQRAASDLHIVPGRQVHVRIAGELVPLDAAGPVMSNADCERMLMPLLGPRRRQRLAELGYVDLAAVVQGVGRMRANVSRVQGGLRGAFRLAIPAPASLDELGLPRELAKVVKHHQGLVVVAGPSGHGKTTTLAALVDLINDSHPFHIITIEDPVEIEHPRKQAVVSQREVGRHTKSFVAALKGSLREDPDVIVIGELRDRETVEIALTAAETGHLVLATMSTPSAAKTIDRLIDMFPPDEQSQARASIAGALRAIIAQRLVPRLRGGVVPAVELVTGVLPLAVMIREDKLLQLPNLMQRGRSFGMIRFDESLLELVRSGKISEDTVRQYAENKKELGQQLPSNRAPAPKLVPEKR